MGQIVTETQKMNPKLSTLACIEDLVSIIVERLHIANKDPKSQLDAADAAILTTNRENPQGNGATTTRTPAGHSSAMAMKTRGKLTREKEEAKTARANKRRLMAASARMITRSKSVLRKDKQVKQNDERGEQQQAASPNMQMVPLSVHSCQVGDEDETSSSPVALGKTTSRRVPIRQASRRGRSTSQRSASSLATSSPRRMMTRSVVLRKGSDPSDDGEDDDDDCDDNTESDSSRSPGSSPGSSRSPRGSSDSGHVFPFLDLPLSVRNRIYDIYAAEYLKHHSAPIKVLVGPQDPADPSSSGRPYMPDSEHRKFHHPPLLLACTQVYKELLPSLLGTISMHMDDWIHPNSETGEDIDMASASFGFAGVPEEGDPDAPLIKTVHLSWHMRNLRSSCSPSRRCSPAMCLTGLPLAMVRRLEIKLQTNDDGLCEPEGHDKHLQVLKLAQPGLKALLETALQTCPRLEEVKFIGCFAHEWLNFVQDEIMRPRGIGVWRGEETWSKEWKRGGDMRVWEWCE